jgi:hypothetical protein
MVMSPSFWAVASAFKLATIHGSSDRHGEALFSTNAFNNMK